MKTLRRFMHYYAPYKRLFVLDMGFATVNSLCALAMPLLVRYLLNVVLQMQDPHLMFTRILWVSLALLLVYLLQGAANYIVASWGHIMGAKMETDMRSQLFAHMEKLSFSYFDRTNTGQMMSRVIADLFDISELAHHGPENFLMASIQFIGAFVVLFSINVPVTSLLILVTALMVFFLQYYNRQMQSTFMDNRRKIADVNALVQDSFAGIRTVQSFSNEATESEKFERGNQAFYRSKKDNYMVMGKYQGVNALMQGFLYLTVVLSGGLSVLQGRMTAVDVVTYLLYVGTFLNPVKRLIDFNEVLQKGRTGFERMLQIIDTEPGNHRSPGRARRGNA